MLVFKKSDIALSVFEALKKSSGESFYPAMELISCETSNLNNQAIFSKLRNCLKYFIEEKKEALSSNAFDNFKTGDFEADLMLICFDLVTISKLMLIFLLNKMFDISERTVGVKRLGSYAYLVILCQFFDEREYDQIIKELVSKLKDTDFMGMLSQYCISYDMLVFVSAANASKKEKMVHDFSSQKINEVFLKFIFGEYDAIYSLLA